MSIPAKLVPAGCRQGTGIHLSACGHAQAEKVSLIKSLALGFMNYSIRVPLEKKFSNGTPVLCHITF
jgi:hypothetical protein